MSDSILRVNRAELFDPAKLFGNGWTIWMGPADGDGLKGESEQDPRSIALAEVDLSKIALATCLKNRETYTSGNERLVRLKAQMSKSIRLDPAFAVALKEHPEQFPADWKGNYVFFDGAVLRSPLGRRCALCADWFDVKVVLFYFWLGYDRYAYDPSAVLASA
jgi:hypothetical protein